VIKTLIGRDLAYINICVAFGFALMNQMNVFGSTVANRAGIWGQLAFLQEPVITLPPPVGEVTGVILIALGLAGATVVFLQSNLVNNQGASLVLYASIFYGSAFLIGATAIANFQYPGVEVFYSLYIFLASLIFINDLVQMNTGGQKAFK